MDFLVWLSPFLFVAVIGLGCWLNQEELFEIARSIQRQKAFSPIQKLTPRKQIRPLPFAAGDRLCGSLLTESIAQLKSYTELVKPDWILGVHPGGRLLSVLIADQLKFPSNRCRFIRTTSHHSKKIILEPEGYKPNEPQGKLLVIDDISRSGDTLGVVKSFLFARNYTDGYSLTRILFSVLVVVWNEDESLFEFRPDWVCYRTDKQWLRLPWSGFSAEVAEAYRLKAANREYDHDVIKKYDRIILDYDYALAFAKHCICSTN
jgi:hypoxanthine phosphoribosyltransferase